MVCCQTTSLPEFHTTCVITEMEELRPLCQNGGQVTHSQPLVCGLESGAMCFGQQDVFYSGTDLSAFSSVDVTLQ